MIIRGGVVAYELGQHKNQMRLSRSFMIAAAPREILGSLVSAAPFIKMCPVTFISAVVSLVLERDRFLEVSHLIHLCRLTFKPVPPLQARPSSDWTSRRRSLGDWRGSLHGPISHVPQWRSLIKVPTRWLLIGRNDAVGSANHGTAAGAGRGH